MIKGLGYILEYENVNAKYSKGIIASTKIDKKPCKSSTETTNFSINLYISNGIVDRTIVIC